MTELVAVVGSVNADLMVHVPQMPSPGQTVLGGELTVSPGGKSANQAVAAARLGAQVTFIGAVGTDPHADVLRDALSQAGVATRLSVVDGASGTAVILVDETAENLIVVSPGANAHLSPADIEGSRDVLAEAAVLGLALEVPPATVLAAAQTAQDLGTPVVLNPSPWRDLEDELLAEVDVLVVNEHEAEQLGAQDGPGLDLPALVVSLGAGGARVHVGAQVTEVPAPQVEAVDTTGCGDAMLGGMLAGLAGGEDLVRAVQLGVAAGAYAATGLGAQPSYGRREQVERLGLSPGL